MQGTGYYGLIIGKRKSLQTVSEEDFNNTIYKPTRANRHLWNTSPQNSRLQILLKCTGTFPDQPYVRP